MPKPTKQTPIKRNASGKLGGEFSLAQQIDYQQTLEGTPKQTFPPMLTPIIAEPHTPVYNMHRYFARRPSNVFEALIKHYTNPGDIVLDPFMGGGVTVVESLRARRRVVGVDLNPVSWFIVDNEAKPINLVQVRKQYKKVENSVKNEINQLYEVICQTCKQPSITKGTTWSTVVKCPKPLCNSVVVLSEAKKVSGGRYSCPVCGSQFSVISCERLQDKMVEVSYTCSTCGTKKRTPTDDDIKRYNQVADKLAHTLGFPILKTRFQMAIQ